jgi:branched-subunit amino acid transport protein AzlD
MQECRIFPFNLLKPILSSDIVNVIIRLLCVQARRILVYARVPHFPF